MPAKRDLTGQRFGRLIVLNEHGLTNSGGCRWLCLCDCGQQKAIAAHNITVRRVISCGCAHRDAAVIHGGTYSREYAAWQSMKSRCLNPKHQSFENYGGRGIAVCERWLDAANFLADMGKRPTAKHSLERIDNDGDYEPANCRWATKAEQAANRRLHRTSKSGAKGVRWAPDQRKWVAFITLGSFESKADAIRARQEADAALAMFEHSNKKEAA